MILPILSACFYQQRHKFSQFALLTSIYSQYTTKIQISSGLTLQRALFLNEKSKYRTKNLKYHPSNDFSFQTQNSCWIRLLG